MRYYLVPMETDQAILDAWKLTVCPKYLSELSKTNCRGVVPVDVNNKRWYIVIFDDDGYDLSALIAKPDVIDANNLKLARIKRFFDDHGIQYASLGPNPSRDQLEELLVEWFTGTKKKLREV